MGIPEDGKSKADYLGYSRILSPLGEVVAESKGEGLAFAKLKLKEGVLNARTKDMFGMNMIKDRKPVLYGALSDLSLYEN